MNRLSVNSQDRVFRWFIRSAMGGGLVWLAQLAFPSHAARETALIETLLLFAPLVITPIGLAAVAPAEQTAVWRVLKIAQPLGAVLVIFSFRREPGVAAAWLASVWLLVTLIIAIAGAGRLLTRQYAAIEGLCVSAGLIYILVGGVWLVISRLGLQPMGFGSTIVLLTAVHFHYAGFAAPLIGGLVGYRVDRGKPRLRRLFFIAALFLIAGPGLVAIGITTSPLIEVVSAFMLALGLLLLSGMILLSVVPVSESRVARVLLTVCAASLVATMALACEYALGEYLNRVLIDIPQMARTHGLINTFGFSFCGLVACCIMRGRNAHEPGRN
jgi:hypothetical protein